MSERTTQTDSKASQSKESGSKGQAYQGFEQDYPELVSAVEKSAEGDLAPKYIMQLQRLFGNHRAQAIITKRQIDIAPPTLFRKSAIQRDPDSADAEAANVDYPGTGNYQALMTWIEQHADFQKFAAYDPNKAAGQCSFAANAMSDVLLQSDPNLQFTVRMIAAYDAQPESGRYWYNHFVLLFNAGGAAIVVDPTQQQFEKGKPMVTTLANWESKIKGTKLRVIRGNDFKGIKAPMYYKDYGSTAEGASALKAIASNPDPNAFGGIPLS